MIARAIDQIIAAAINSRGAIFSRLISCARKVLWALVAFATFHLSRGATILRRLVAGRDISYSWLFLGNLACPLRI